MDASARQEAERVRTKLDALNFAYAGMPHGEEGSKFVAIVYNPLTPEQRQLRWMQGMSTGVIPMPPRPPQVSEKQWMKAVVENPDPENYVPHPLVGANELQTRIAWQQTRATDLANHATSLHQAHETLQERLRLAMQETEAKARRQVALRKRLLDVMRRVELTRCLNQPTQPDELRVSQRLSDLQKQVSQTQHLLMQLQDHARSTAATRAGQGAIEFTEASEELVPVLKDHRQKLQKLGIAAQRDQRDVALIAKRVAVTTGSRV
jgi:Nucleoporin complex subunit 54